MLHNVERKACPRHAVAQYDTYVQIKDSTGKRITRARLLNISTSGALVCADDIVAMSQRIALRLERAPEMGWIDAEPVHFGQLQRVGIRFRPPCRPEFIAAAVSGGNAQMARPSDDHTLLDSANGEVT